MKHLYFSLFGSSSPPICLLLFLVRFFFPLSHFTERYLQLQLRLFLPVIFRSHHLGISCCSFFVLSACISEFHDRLLGYLQLSHVCRFNSMMLHCSRRWMHFHPCFISKPSFCFPAAYSSFLQTFQFAEVGLFSCPFFGEVSHCFSCFYYIQEPCNQHWHLVRWGRDGSLLVLMPSYEKKDSCSEEERTVTVC